MQYINYAVRAPNSHLLYVAPNTVAFRMATFIDDDAAALRKAIKRNADDEINLHK